MVSGETSRESLDAYDRAHGIASQPTRSGGLIVPHRRPESAREADKKGKRAIVTTGNRNE